jgi:hypothetical protein
MVSVGTLSEQINVFRCNEFCVSENRYHLEDDGSTCLVMFC